MKDRPRRLRRTILLGAGASRASKYSLPTMAGFFGEKLELHPDLTSALQDFDPDPAACNLEEVLVYLDIARRKLEHWDSSLKALYGGFHAKAYDDCVAYIQRRLHISGPDPDPLHTSLFETLCPEENVLSVNYDLVADQALAAVEVDEKGSPLKSARIGKLVGLVGIQLYGGGFQPPALTRNEYVGGQYLKLHGSLDWLRCKTNGCFGSMSYFPSGQAELAEAHVTSAPCRYCGGYLEPAIIPPSAGKLIDDRGKMSFLWNLGRSALEWADEWVFIGLSLAFTDFELSWLLRYTASLGQLRQIRVVNPDEGAVERVARLLHPRTLEISHYSSIEQYLDSIEN